MTIRELQEFLQTAELVLGPDASVLVQINDHPYRTLDLKLVNGKLVLKTGELLLPTGELK